MILDADNAAIEYAPRRADLVLIIDRMEQQPNTKISHAEDEAEKPPMT